MTRSKQLFFIALLPPDEVQQFVNQIKQQFAEIYDSSAAQKSPPHITLQPPFKWQLEELPELEQKLQEFAQTQAPIPITLNGFGAFRPRVIYINVLKTPELLGGQKDLMNYLESSLSIIDPVSKNRPFAPHLTVAFRDLSKQNFRKAWSEFEQRKLHFEFTVLQLTLLNHNGRRWEIRKEFPFLS